MFHLIFTPIKSVSSILFPNMFRITILMIFHDNWNITPANTLDRIIPSNGTFL